LWGVVTPNLNFTNFGDVLNSELSRDTITAIDTATDTCTLAKTGAALIFYHCEPNSPLRDNGAIEGGAAGFAVGDEVIVLWKFDKSKVYVIGHVDGIRSCGFLKIKLFRDDDIVNPLGELHHPDFYLQVFDINFNAIADIYAANPESYFKRNTDGSRLKDKDGNDIPVYNPELKCWEFEGYIWNKNEPTHPTTFQAIWSGGEYHPLAKQFIIVARCENGIPIYYKMLTPEEISAGKWPRTHKLPSEGGPPIVSGNYALSIPYLKTESYISLPKLYNEYKVVTSIRHETTIKSSLPYSLLYSISEHILTPVYWAHGISEEAKWCSAPRQELIFAPGIISFISDDGVFTLESSGVGEHPAFSTPLEGVIMSPGALTYGVTGTAIPADILWECWVGEDNQHGEYGPETAIFDYIGLSQIAGASIDVDYSYEYCVWHSIPPSFD